MYYVLSSTSYGVPSFVVDNPYVRVDLRQPIQDLTVTNRADFSVLKFVETMGSVFFGDYAGGMLHHVSFEGGLVWGNFFLDRVADTDIELDYGIVGGLYINQVEDVDVEVPGVDEGISVWDGIGVDLDIGAIFGDVFFGRTLGLEAVLGRVYGNVTDYLSELGEIVVDEAESGASIGSSYMYYQFDELYRGFHEMDGKYNAVHIGRLHDGAEVLVDGSEGTSLSINMVVDDAEIVVQDSVGPNAWIGTVLGEVELNYDNVKGGQVGVGQGFASADFWNLEELKAHLWGDSNTTVGNSAGVELYTAGGENRTYVYGSDGVITRDYASGDSDTLHSFDSGLLYNGYENVRITGGNTAGVINADGRAVFNVKGGGDHFLAIHQDGQVRGEAYLDLGAYGLLDVETAQRVGLTHLGDHFNLDVVMI